MDKVLAEHDTFIVQSKYTDAQTVKPILPTPTHTATLPGGQHIHILDRAMFDRAVKAAVQAKK